MFRDSRQLSKSDAHISDVTTVKMTDCGTYEATESQPSVPAPQQHPTPEGFSTNAHPRDVPTLGSPPERHYVCRVNSMEVYALTHAQRKKQSDCHPTAS